MGRPDDVRAAMEDRQRRWMSERTAEETRHDVQREFASSAAAAAPPGRGHSAGSRGAPPAVPPATPSGFNSAFENARAHAAAAAARAYSCSASDGEHGGSAGRSHGHGDYADAGPAPHVVLDRITERLAQRMRSELVAELSRESAKHSAAQRERSQRVESRLSAEVMSHTCPICYELMAGRSCAPIMLVPCGHTFCEACIALLGSAQASDPGGQSRVCCPVCRAPVEARAPNVSLRSIINALLCTRDAVRSQAAQPVDGGEVAAAMLAAAAGGSGAGGYGGFSAAGRPRPGSRGDGPDYGSGAGGGGYGGEPGAADGELFGSAQQWGSSRQGSRGGMGGRPIDPALAEQAAEAARYASQYQAYCMRVAVLAHEAADTRVAADSAHARTCTAETVLRHLAAEREKADERARAAAREAGLLAAQETEQRAKLDALRAAEVEIAGQLALLERTLAPLRVEADKARLLALNLDPHAQLDSG